MAVILCAVLLPGCSDYETRIEVTTPSGRVLDCRDEYVAYTVGGTPDPEAVGADSAQEALDRLGIDRPQGVAGVETTTATEVTFLFENANDHRLGWVVASSDERGWFVVLVEKCGTE